MIKIITDKNEWDKLASTAGASFLQSYEWGEILESLGQKVERILVEQDGQTALAQVVYKKLSFGLKYVQIHKGPTCHSERSEESLNKLINYWREQKCVFARLEPPALNIFSPEIRRRLKLIRDINPPATMVLDLKNDLSVLLNSFHPKTRYNINLAGRKNLTVSHEKDFGSFWQIFVKTGERDNFLLHPKKTYAAAVGSPAVRQITVYSDKTPLASVCIFSFNKIAYYLYGASDHEYRQLMAPYLAQWEAIKWAKQSGHAIYDFFGVAPRCHSEKPNCHPRENGDPVVVPSGLDSRLRGNDNGYAYDPHHRYAGVSRFKIGFNGEYREEPGTFDLPLRPILYSVYKLIRRLK